ncbi:hypothetical protein F5050DRAFT_49312 [Lentinula boryana]|uniref:Uncharacterized protein n=1 Tax=Lentinula boryana TaxID=40481 RepID=A0ABQ8QE00_9AGAR|nr:hypothetical protein F5050DRAFT_49312 [Lentinula boryana]
MTNRQLKLAQNAQKTVTKSAVDPPVDHIGWKHPAELIYSTGTYWTNKKLIYYCIANALSVNPPSLTMPGVCSVSGGKKTVVLSDRYRIPIIYASRWQWAKLKELITAADEEKTLRWSEAKYEVLHVARVWKILTDEGPSTDTVDWCYPSLREQRLEEVKEWRCHTLDRVLTRFRMGCFSSEPSRAEKFWEEYQESEYSKDVLEFGTLIRFLFQWVWPNIFVDWQNWLLQPRDGVTLSESGYSSGLDSEVLMRGLVEKDGAWIWETASDSIPAGTPAWSLRQIAGNSFNRQTKTQESKSASDASSSKPLSAVTSRARKSQSSASVNASTSSSSLSTPISTTPVSALSDVSSSPVRLVGSNHTSSVIVSNKASSPQKTGAATSIDTTKSIAGSSKLLSPVPAVELPLKRRKGGSKPATDLNDPTVSGPSRLQSNEDSVSVALPKKAKRKLKTRASTVIVSPKSVSTPDSQSVTSSALPTSVEIQKQVSKAVTTRELSSPAAVSSTASSAKKPTASIKYPILASDSPTTIVKTQTLDTSVPERKTTRIRKRDEATVSSGQVRMLLSPSPMVVAPGGAVNLKGNEEDKSNFDANGKGKGSYLTRSPPPVLSPHVLPAIPTSISCPPVPSSSSKRIHSNSSTANTIDLFKNGPSSSTTPAASAMDQSLPIKTKNPINVEWLSPNPLSSFSSAVSTGISNSVNDVIGNGADVGSESTIGRGLKRSGSPLEKSGRSKLRQVRKNSARLFRSTPETFTEIPGISNNSSPVSPIPTTTHAQGVSTIESSDVDTKSTSISSLLTNFATIDNTSSSLPSSLDNSVASSSCTSHAPASHRPFMLSMPLGHLIRDTSRCGSSVSGAGTGDIEDGLVNSISSDSSLSQPHLSVSPSSFLRHPLAHLLGEPLI